MSKNSWTIHKFGGSSLADASCFERVAAIVAGLKGERIGVVVSAMHGTTDELLDLVALAEKGKRRSIDPLGAIGKRYTETAQELVSGDRLAALLDAWSEDAADIKARLESIAPTDPDLQHERDVIAGYGEIWSARLMARVLEKRCGSERAGAWIDARKVVTVRLGELGPQVQWKVSRENWTRALSETFQGIAVITGFIATDEGGRQTTLGRNGSDFSAAIFAALSHANELNIWSDVDGVMSADPKRVPEARVIDSLTYSEAMELAYFGAKVIHPRTLRPAVDDDIPIVIRNSFAPERPGSHIRTAARSTDQIKGITAIDGMTLINLEGSGMIGVPGTADRLFAALRQDGVSVTLISQASSEHSICIAVPDEVVERAQRLIAAAFADELASGQIQRVDATSSQSIIAVVGDGMAGTPGIAGKFFATLGRAGINVRAIAQGSSERNISAVVDTAETTRALRAVHSGFYLSAKTISIGLIGPGQVGATLLNQLQRQKARLHEEFNLDLRIRAIARSQQMLLGERQIDLQGWSTTMQSAAVDTNLDRFEQHVHADHLPHAAIIDCTASEVIARRYADWLRRGVHVITPNKKAFSGDAAYYAQLKASGQTGSSHYFYETTVGAALPIIRTVRDLVDTGDRIHSIQGILSGTLAYLFNVFDGSVPFSRIVLEAKANGFTEPDPRDDLSGMDVARKLVILARENSQDINIGAFPVQNLVPEALRNVSLDEFTARLPEFDEEMKALLSAAKDRSRTLRYMARLNSDGTASVRLEQMDMASPFSNINLTDSIVQFETDRYSANPLVVQGPGAGPAVTAGGVFADLLRLATFLGEGVSI